MLVLWPCVLLAAASAHRVEESAESRTSPPPPRPPPRPPLSQRVDSLNSTALYPVNRTSSAANKIKAATSWKIETTFGESKLDTNSSSSKEALAVDRPGNSSSSSEFRGSQQLGNFVDEDSLEAGGGHRPTHQSEEFGGYRPTHQSGEFGKHRPTNGPPADFAGAIKKPPTGFIQSLKEHKFPKESFKQYDFPYKLEAPILTRVKDAWKPTAGLESHPTDESPVRVPAGGLYTLPDPFQVKPGTVDEDFGLEFSHDGKEHDVIKKPRVNPWKNLLHLLTALIPVGVIFSALTPSVITVGPEPSASAISSSNPFRRAGGGFAPPPPMSEPCRRRLLCELRSQTNYPYSSTRNVRGKQCYRLRCEDPEGLASALQWLLAHQQPTERPTAGYAPTGDQWDHYT